MFRFAEPEMFYLLLLVPLSVWLYVVAMSARARRIRRFGNPATVAALIPDASPRRVRNKFILMLLAIAFIVTALARPQSGSKLRERETSGVEMMLVVDVSNSMMAQDFTPTRLDRTKAAINRLLNDTEQDKVGLVVFAGDAYVQLPVTADYNTARTFADRLSPDMVTKQGTAIGAAIDLAANSYSSKSEEGNVMIIISDGENHEDDALAAAQAAADRGIVIYTIGIGTPDGSPIQMGGDYIKDENGEMVLSKLDETMLQQVALTTEGAYVRATNQAFGLAEIVERIRQTEGGRHTEPVFEQYDEYFQWLLGLGLLLLIADTIMLSRRNRLLARFNIFN